MTRRWPCIVVALPCLLAVGTSASAEGAWVVWYEATIWGTGMEGYHGWDLFAAYPTTDLCEKHLTVKMEDIYEYYKKERQRSPNPEWVDTITYEWNMISTTFEWTTGQRFSGGQSLRYLCLPDSIDPCGPKEK